jgi:hypothetical protein
MTRIAMAVAALLVSASAGIAEETSVKQPIMIGDATMTEDRTIIINLRRTADGMNVSGIAKFPVSDPHYKEVLDHIGGMSPGETKLVPAWPDQGSQK